MIDHNPIELDRNGHTIKVGQIWRHRRKGDHRVSIVAVGAYTWGKVDLHHHRSGRFSQKGVHYFLEDYALDNDQTA